MRQVWMVGLAMAAGVPAAAAAQERAPKVEEVPLAELSAMLAAKRVTSEAATRAYLDRIAAMDRKGPTLRSVIAINPEALGQARASDARRRAGRALGPLDGVPILVKDNIETRDPMPTTAGSLALRDNLTRRDAPVIARLRAAGAVILGKTNLSEWANIRSTRSMSGWSAVGGLARNPYALDRTACGSSSGTGVAVAASFAAAGIGTETDGSVVCPSAMNGLVGLKPTVGLVSRTHIVPISHSQDTAGPMARSVADVAMLFSAIVGSDPADPTTAGADTYRRDYAAALATPDALKGRRIGVIRPEMPPVLAERYEAALHVLRAAGAVLVDVAVPKLDGIADAEFNVFKMELKSDLNAYLASTPPGVTARTLKDLIAFNVAHASEEMPYFGQEIFEMAEKTGGVDDPGYKAARETSLRLASTQGIDAMLKAANATILVEPTYGIPWLSDPVSGDQFSGPSASELPAIAGYPHLTVPMGLAKGLPVGLSFVGPKWSEATLLAAGHAYEQAAKARVAPAYAPTIDAGRGLEGVGLGEQPEEPADGSAQMHS